MLLFNRTLIRRLMWSSTTFLFLFLECHWLFLLFRGVQQPFIFHLNYYDFRRPFSVQRGWENNDHGFKSATLTNTGWYLGNTYRGGRTFFVQFFGRQSHDRSRTQASMKSQRYIQVIVIYTSVFELGIHKKLIENAWTELIYAVLTGS